MEEMDIKNALKEEFPEENAPADLKAELIARGKAIQAGRESEKRIAAGNGDKEAFAEAVLGRLLMTVPQPKGSDIEALKEQISNNPFFRSLSEKSPGEQLKSLQGGKFLSEAAAEFAHDKEPEAKAKEIKVPV